MLITEVDNFKCLCQYPIHSI